MTDSVASLVNLNALTSQLNLKRADLSLNLTLIFLQFNFKMAKDFEQRVYEFEGFRLDASHLMLYRNTQELTLPPKAIETLLALIEKRGEIVHKDELMEIIWNDSVVEESNLSQYLHILRKTLGKKADGKPFIETLRRRGYRFTADVESIKSAELENPLNESESLDSQIHSSKPTNAFQAYQLSRMYFQQNTIPSLIESRKFLEEAFRFDADYAPAYAALAEQNLMEGIYGMKTPIEGFAEAKIALRRAFELNENSAETYAAAGFLDLICDWNFTKAEQNLQKSLELNPHCAFGYNYLGHTLMFQCQFDEAIKSLQRAVKIEPMGFYNWSILMIGYFMARKYEKVIKESEKLLALNSNWLVALILLCWSLEQVDRGVEAIALYKKFLNEPGGEILKRWIGYAYATVGDEENARKSADLILAESREQYVSPIHLAAIYSALNEPNQACFYLEKSLALRDPWTLWIAADARFDNLRTNPRFQKIESLVFSKSERLSYAQANST
jgi:DNA-binding winged helix-turn-helix (wHTH) protein